MWEASRNPRSSHFFRRQSKKAEGEVELFRAWAAETQPPAEWMALGKSLQLPEPVSPPLCHLSDRSSQDTTPVWLWGLKEEMRVKRILPEHLERELNMKKSLPL